MKSRRQFDSGVDASRNDTALKRAEPGRLRVRSLVARGLTVVLLAAFAALLAPPPVVQAQTAVPPDWSLIPSELGPSDTFRLVFLSSTKRNASSTDIADYNTFVQDRAAAGHVDIQAYCSGFRAVDCTADTDALDNTATNYTASDKGVPIYWLNGANADDDYEDFYDGSWDEEVNDKNATTAPTPPWTATTPSPGANTTARRLSSRATPEPQATTARYTSGCPIPSVQTTAPSAAPKPPTTATPAPCTGSRKSSRCPARPQ